MRVEARPRAERSLTPLRSVEAIDQARRGTDAHQRTLLLIGDREAAERAVRQARRSVDVETGLDRTFRAFDRFFGRLGTTTAATAVSPPAPAPGSSALEEVAAGGTDRARPLAPSFRRGAPVEQPRSDPMPAEEAPPVDEAPPPPVDEGPPPVNEQPLPPVDEEPPPPVDEAPPPPIDLPPPVTEAPPVDEEPAPAPSPFAAIGRILDGGQGTGRRLDVRF